uniref:Uncharacterized protein n=1 Tax=Octopus bimaculoides TaxID=37653 RepID=A0A0L8I7A8_OCTBM
MLIRTRIHTRIDPHGYLRITLLILFPHTPPIKLNLYNLHPPHPYPTYSHDIHYEFSNGSYKFINKYYYYNSHISPPLSLSLSHSLSYTHRKIIYVYSYTQKQTHSTCARTNTHLHIYMHIYYYSGKKINIS